MQTKLSEDLISVSKLKQNPTGVIEHAANAHRPALLTRRGRCVAVLQSLADYEQAEEERAFMRAVVAGIADVEAGRLVSLQDVKKQLKI
jgi:prevent-host-death family protein